MNDEEFATVKFALSTISSLLNYHKLLEVYSLKLYIDIAILMYSASSTKVSFTSVLQFLNGAQFLNATFAAAATFALLAFLTAISPVTRIYTWD